MSNVELNAARTASGLRAIADGLAVNPDLFWAQRAIRDAATKIEELERERDRARALAEEFHRDQVRLLIERDAWHRCASELYDAAAYGLAQWESATPATLAEKIVPALQAFQKLKAQ